ncbi:hypothetical protein M8J75_011315 [Diaphorina citri]|nr:hypothetical protein M8J75_011315 [Diaphorina citri]
MILLSYDSLDPDGKYSSKKIGSVSTTGNGITKSSDDKPKATASKQSSTGSGVKTPVLPKAASNPTSSPKNCHKKNGDVVRGAAGLGEADERARDALEIGVLTVY